MTFVQSGNEDGKCMVDPIFCDWETDLLHVLWYFYIPSNERLLSNNKNVNFQIYSKRVESQIS